MGGLGGVAGRFRNIIGRVLKLDGPLLEGAMVEVIASLKDTPLLNNEAFDIPKFSGSNELQFLA